MPNAFSSPVKIWGKAFICRVNNAGQQKGYACISPISLHKQMELRHFIKGHSSPDDRTGMKKFIYSYI